MDPKAFPRQHVSAETRLENMAGSLHRQLVAMTAAIEGHEFDLARSLAANFIGDCERANDLANHLADAA